MPEENAALRELLLAYPVGQETEVAHAVEAVRRDVPHQTAQEFHGLERHGAQAVAALVLLGAEAHLAVLQGDEPVVGDGHAMGRAGEVLQDMPGVPDGLFSVDDPLLVAQGGEESLPGLRFNEFPTATRQGQLTLAIEMLQPLKVQPPKAP
jgi:hypothetical protein